MNKIDWAAKLSSRKFWSFLAEFVVSILIALNAGEDTIIKVTAIITAFGGMVVYLLVEGAVDKARAKNPPIV